MQAFKVKAFARWESREGLNDVALASAVIEMEHGLIGAKLGGHVVKKRVALPGRGKRGSSRTLVAFKQGKRRSSSMDLQRTNAPILVARNCRR